MAWVGFFKFSGEAKKKKTKKTLDFLENEWILPENSTSGAFWTLNSSVILILWQIFGNIKESSVFSWLRPFSHCKLGHQKLTQEMLLRREKSCCQEANIRHFPPMRSEIFLRSFVWCRVRKISNSELGIFLSLGKFSLPSEIGHILIGYYTRVRACCAKTDFTNGSAGSCSL